MSEPLYHYFRNPASICNDPNAGHDHLTSALTLIARVEAGNTLDLRNLSSRDTYRRYLISRARIELEFIRAREDGEVLDFQMFIKRYRELFYTLEVSRSPGQP